jgi:fructose/tagatose bisphosphate aldolase
MNQFKLGFGPMSKDIVEILCKHVVDNDYPLMIIASRNQVDYDTGYVCTTAELAAMVKSYNHPKLLLCRDHCGTGFSDLDRGLPADAGFERVKTTIRHDILSGFDLIHIDVSRIQENQLERAQELIDYAISLNPTIKIEFGSEDNTGIDIDSSLARIDRQLEFLQQYKNNVVFFVTQTGSLTKNDQVGQFDIERNQLIAEQIHAAGFLFKEHNADYFSQEDITNRITAGVDSLNIAPQLGVVQTTLLKEFITVDNQHLWDNFVDLVYAGNMWQRWVSEGVTDKHQAVIAAGHYHFGSAEYSAIIESIDNENFRAALTRKINSILEFYKSFDSTHPDVKFQAQLKKKLAELRARDPFIYR